MMRSHIKNQMKIELLIVRVLWAPLLDNWTLGFHPLIHLPSKSSMPSEFLSPSFISSSISSSEMDSPLLRMMRANSSLSM